MMTALTPTVDFKAGSELAAVQALVGAMKATGNDSRDAVADSE